MNANVNETRQASGPTREMLLAEGFTIEEINLLEGLRAAYPVSEFVITPQALGRLELLKWLHDQGRLRD